MIIYKPSDPPSEIIFNLAQVAYEHRKLTSPDAEFILGEWVGLGVGETAQKISSGTFVMPAMVYTETGRHDVAESEGVTVVKGSFRLSTMNYVAAQSFAIGDRVIVTSSGGIGKLASYAAAGNGTYYVIGEVRVPPQVDGVSRLVVDVWANPMIVVKS
ncbi:MAG: hypothetical protein WCY30_00100 [Candidatus Neomarinimicrobiota bacterium]|jgi:hypothetical protein